MTVNGRQSEFILQKKNWPVLWGRRSLRWSSRLPKLRFRLTACAGISPGWFFSGDDAAGTNTAADSASCSSADRVWDSLVNPISAAAGTDRTIFKRDLNAGPTPTSSAVPAFFYLGNVTGLFVICKLNPWWSETSARTIMLLSGRIWKKGACFLQKSEYNKLQER